MHTPHASAHHCLRAPAASLQLSSLSAVLTPGFEALSRLTPVSSKALRVQNAVLTSVCSEALRVWPLEWLLQAKLHITTQAHSRCSRQGGPRAVVGFFASHQHKASHCQQSLQQSLQLSPNLTTRQPPTNRSARRHSWARSAVVRHGHAIPGSGHAYGPTVSYNFNRTSCQPCSSTVEAFEPVHPRSTYRCRSD